MKSRRAVNQALLMALVGAAPAVGAQSSSQRPFPSRPIRLIVPYAAGGGGDTVSRMIAGPVGERLGQPVVVENRGGAGGSIGAAMAAQAEPDGHTVLFDALGHVINPHLIRDLTFSYERAFAPVTMLATHTIIMVGSVSHRARSLADALEQLRRDGTNVSYGSPGSGSGPHLATESLLRRAGVRATHVPYRGAGPALQDVMAGSIPFAVSTASAATALVREGKMIGLAVLSQQRLATLPAIPTAAESGLPGFSFDEWSGLFVPATTPETVIRRLHNAVRETLHLPAIRERFVSLGTVPSGSTPQEFASFLAAQRSEITQLVNQAGLRPS
ncbi:MAG: twin-arginine translocation pathway signal protein [Betaproteobacteria bacterium]|nr:twin-arginine translocation pathway signal protein [Betaproteobacteria bacterium]